MTFDYASAPKVDVKECNLCGASRFEPVRTRDRYGLPVRVVKCLECGLRFINPRMTDEAYLDFYRNGTYRRLLEQLHGKSVTAESIEPGQWWYAKRLVDILEPYVKEEHETLLDIGGSTGVVADAVAVHFELKATVVEPSEAEAQRAKLRMLETVESLNAVESVFDVVLLCQTVEHLTDIRGALERVWDHLEDGGVFFVDIAKGSQAKVDHCYYLDLGTTLAYLKSVGFREISIKREGYSNFPQKDRRISFVAVKHESEAVAERPSGPSGGRAAGAVREALADV